MTSIDSARVQEAIMMINDGQPGYEEERIGMDNRTEFSRRKENARSKYENYGE